MDTEKVLTTDGSSNFASGALMGAGLNKGGNDLLTAALMNGNNQQWNNPMWLIWAMLFFGNGGLMGNRGDNNLTSQIQNLQGIVQDNHNSDLLNQAMAGNTAAITQLAGNLNVANDQLSASISNVRDAITAANGNIQLAAQQMISNNNLQSAAMGRQICEGFCGVQRDILSQGYQNQIGNLQQSGLIQGIASNISQLLNNGFTQLGFQAERDACTTRENSTANTQRIIDTLSNHWQAETIAENNQLKLQLALANIPAQVAAAVAGTSTTTKSA